MEHTTQRCGSGLADLAHLFGKPAVPTLTRVVPEQDEATGAAKLIQQAIDLLFPLRLLFSTAVNNPRALNEKSPRAEDKGFIPCRGCWGRSGHPGGCGG